MAAPICEACFSTIENRKSYRKLNGENFESLFASIGIRAVETLCASCFHKFNKVANFESDLKEKINKMLNAKTGYVNSILQLPGIVKTIACPPIQDVSVASIKRERDDSGSSDFTPDPKRILLCSPSLICVPTVPQPKSMVDNSTQTPIPTNNFSVNISIKYGGQEKTRIIHDKVEQNVVKGFFNKSSKSAVLKHLLQNDKYKREAISCIGRYVKDEVNNLCRHQGSLLKATSETILLMASFDWTKIAEEMKLKLPTLMGVLSCIYESKQTPNIMRLVTAISVLLYNRSQYINLIQILFGIVFASYGLRKEGIEILHNIGLSPSYATIREKKKLFNTAYEENVTDVMDTYKEFRIKLENEMFDDNNGNNYTDNNSDILTTDEESSELVNVKQENETVSDNSDTFPTDLENIAVGKVKQENETESDNSDVHVLTAKIDNESINNDTVAMEIKHEPLIGQEYDLDSASSSV